MCRQILALFLVIILLFLIQLPVIAETTLAEQQKISDISVKPSQHLGLAFPGSNPRYYHVMAEAGIGVVRLGASWKRIEPERNHFNWKGLDKRVVRLQELGIEPFLTLYSDVNWAVRKDTMVVKNATPRNAQEWRRFVAAVVERYDGDGDHDAPNLHAPVRYYQVANEWISDKNKSGGWAGSSNELIEYINTAYDAVKAGDPRALFVLGGIAAFNIDLMALYEKRAEYIVHQKFNAQSSVTLAAKDLHQAKYVNKLKDVYHVISKTRFDIGDLHLYGLSDRNVARVAVLRELIDDKPMLSSECGGPSLDYKVDYQPADHFTAVFDWNLSALSESLPFCLWFLLGEDGGATWGNRKTALFDQNKKAKPGYHAYRLLAALLEDMSHVERISDGIFWIYRKSKAPILVAWKYPDENGGHNTAENTLRLERSKQQQTTAIAGELSVSIPAAWKTVEVLKLKDVKKGIYQRSKQSLMDVLLLANTPLIMSPELPDSLR